MAENNKMSRREFVTIALSVGSFIISLGSLWYSWLSGENTEKRLQYQEKTRFRVIQNLQSDNPYIVLYNESTKPLEFVPDPECFMYIPHRMSFEDENRGLILQPLAYSHVQEKVIAGKTTEEVVRLKLPKYFKGGLTALEAEYSFIRPKQTGEKILVQTLPFLVLSLKFPGYAQSDKEPDEYRFLSIINKPYVYINKDGYEIFSNKLLTLVDPLLIMPPAGNDYQEGTVYKFAHSKISKFLETANFDEIKSKFEISNKPNNNDIKSLLLNIDEYISMDTPQREYDTIKDRRK